MIRFSIADFGLSNKSMIEDLGFSPNSSRQSEIQKTDCEQSNRPKGLVI